MAAENSAWWPGGRTAQKALRASPLATASTAAQIPPTARSAASPEERVHRRIGVEMHVAVVRNVSNIAST